MNCAIIETGSLKYDKRLPKLHPYGFISGKKISSYQIIITRLGRLWRYTVEYTNDS